jgi:hypothetical protein
MKNKRTFYHLILDRSGSMNSCIEQTVDGVNQQIERIKEVSARFPEQELITSLTLFNNQITPVWTRLRSDQLRQITFADYKPDGMTALLDAVGTTIHEIQKSTGTELEADEASVVVVIITDGYENSSREYTHEQVASLVRELEMTGKWTFSYIGATLDAIEIAVSFNIKKTNAMRFNPEVSSIMYNKLNSSLYSYLEDKQSGKIRKDFLDDDEGKQ